MKNIAFVAAALLAATSLFAQTPTTETLVQGPVDHGFVVAPDFKFTDVNGDFATLAGGYGGWVLNKRLLLGGGIYTLTNGDSVDSMTYGGGVLEYFVNQGSLVNVSVRGLVGGGTASLERSFAFPQFGSRNAPAFGRRPFQGGGSRAFAASSSFFVAEPELDVMLNVTEAIRLSFGGGYRFIGGASGLNERLDGFTANAALKLSFF